MMMGPWWHGDGSWWSWIFMLVWVMLFWTLVIVGIVVSVRVVQGGPRRGSSAPAAEQILAERFARGEIDENEFRSRREALRVNR
ncbi:MAG: SHOCT domain-containing protein [Kineosporiaceae bacterium]